MSINTKITEQLRHQQLQAAEIELYKNSFVLVPYQVGGGIIDYTNRGVTSRQVRPEDYETFKRVWTGNDAANIQWKNSIYFVKNQSLTKDGEETAKIVFQLGEVLLGLMETNSNEVRVQQDTSLSDYVAQDIKETYTFRVDRKQFEITDYHLICLWKIPEISGSTLFRISNVEKDYVGRELVGYVVSFESINQDFSNTGSARQQNIMPSAVGQGYLECKVEDSTWPERLGKEKFSQLSPGIDYLKFYDRYITADYSKIQNRPAKKIVVKQYGLGILSTIACVGRPVQSGENFEIFKAPRLLFPINYITPSTPTLFRTQNNNNNFYFGEFNSTIQYWTDWNNKLKNMLNYGSHKWEYDGFLMYSKSDLQATNPIIEVGNNKVKTNYEWELYGKLVQQPTTVKRVPWEFATQQKDIDTSLVVGCSAKYRIGANKPIHDHMFDNYWTQKYMTTLPIEIYSSVSIGQFIDGIFGLLGGVVADMIQNFSIWLIGTSTNWVGRIIPLKYQSFRGIISADFINCVAEQWQLAGNKNAFDINILKANGDSNNPASMFFNGNTMITGIEADLTDRFLDNNSGKIFNTNNIGQTKDELGENLLPTGQKLLLDGNQNLISVNNDGYIIDEIQLCGIFNGEYSVEFLDEDNEVIWSSIFQSAGKWADSVRDIWTIRNTSVYNRENIYFTEPFKYPEKLDEPLLAIPTLPTSEEWGILASTNGTRFNNEYFVGIPEVSSGGGIYPVTTYYWCSLLPKNIQTEFDIVIYEYNENIPDFGTLNIYYDFIYDFSNKYYFRNYKLINKEWEFGTRVSSLPLTNNVLYKSDSIKIPLLNQTKTYVLPPVAEVVHYGNNRSVNRKYWLKAFQMTLYEKDNKLLARVTNIQYNDPEVLYSTPSVPECLLPNISGDEHYNNNPQANSKNPLYDWNKCPFNMDGFKDGEFYGEWFIGIHLVPKI